LIFPVHRLTGTATELHHRDLPAARGVWILEAVQPALVLGSTQPMLDVNDVEVVRRRSGGGAVFVEPGGTLWVDVVVPRGDELWEDDIGRSTYWLGDAWARACGPDATVHRGAIVRTPWSDRVCFAGLGPGEVTIGGAKVVGISQRRTRESARFQCVAYEQWNPDPLHELLGLDVDLAAAGVGMGRLSAVEVALLAQFA